MKYHTRKTLAAELGISIATLNRLVKTGVIPYRMVGKRIRFDLDVAAKAFPYSNQPKPSPADLQRLPQQLAQLNQPSITPSKASGK